MENTISAENLRADLLARKVQVEEEKRKEREQKRLNETKYFGEEFNPFEVDVGRSVATSAASSFISEPGSDMYASFITSEPGSDVYTSIVSEPGSDVYAPLYPKESVAVYTSFQTKQAPVKVQVRVEEALRDLSAVVEERKSRFKIKATLKSEDVGIAVRIYSLPNVSLCD